MSNLYHNWSISLVQMHAETYSEFQRRRRGRCPWNGSWSASVGHATPHTTNTSSIKVGGTASGTPTRNMRTRPSWVVAEALVRLLQGQQPFRGAEEFHLGD